MANYRLFSGNGTGVTFADAAGRTLGVEFYVTAPAWITTVWYYRASTAVSAPTGARVWTAAGTVVSSVLSFGTVGTTTGWLQATLATPIALTPNTRYVAAAVAPGSTIPGQSNYWASGAGSAGITSGLLVAPSQANATASGQGRFNAGSTLTFPGTASPSGANYDIDVTVTDVSPSTSYSQTVTDAAGAADSPTQTSTAPRSVTDVGAVADTAAAASSVAQTTFDQALAADTVAASTAYARVLIDTADAQDTQTSVRGLSVSQVDAADTTDTSSPVVDYQRFWVEPAAVDDTATRSSDSARNIIDTGGATDVTEQAQDIAAAVTDSIDAVDETEFNSGELTEVTDAIDVGDLVEAESEYAPELLDAAGAADLIAREAGYTQELLETVGVADTASALVDHRNDVTDLAGTVDQIAVVVHSTPVITDAVGASDTFTQGVPASRQVVDAARAVDSVDVNTVGRVTTPADGALATDSAVVLAPSASMPVPVAIETTTAITGQQAAQQNVPEAAGTDTVFTPPPTGSYPTEQAGDWELTFTPIVLVDDGEFAVAVNDEDRTPTYVLKADWNRNGLYDHPLSDLTDLVEEVTVSRALNGTLPVEVGLVEGYSTAELSVRLAGEIPADAFEPLGDRRNLVANPSFETGTAGWSSTADAVGAMPREQAPFLPISGGWYAYTRRSTAGDLTVAPFLSATVPGQRYTGSIYINRDGTNDVRLDLDWYNSSNVYLTSTFGSLNNPPTGTWTRLVTSGTAPAGATQARIFVRFINQAANFWVRLDGAMLEQSSSTVVGTYFDGSKAGAIWEGTAHNSTSLLQGAQLAPRATGREFDVVDAFAPYRPDSPLYGRPVLQSPIYLEVGFLADDGPRLSRRFTGTVTQIHPESAARIVELRAVDPVNRLRATLTLSGVAMYDSIMARRGPEAYRSRMNSQWLIDYALRRNGIYTSPPARGDAVLSVTGHGSMIPEVGWGGAPEEYYPTYRGDMWFPGRFGGALATIGGGPIGRWWLNDEVTAAAGTGFGMSMWLARYPSDGVYHELFSMALTTDASWFLLFGISDVGIPVIGLRQTGGSTYWSYSNSLPPSVGQWQFVGAHVSFTSTTMVVRWRVNGASYTETITIATRAGNWKPGVHISYNWGFPFQNFQLWKGVTPPTAPWQGEDPNWVPQAELDPGGNELTGIPELLGVDSWELIKAVTDAEGSTFDFDEYGKPRFRTARGDAYYGRAKRVADPVSADRNLADLVSTTDEASIRNIVNVKTKTQLIGNWEDFYVSKDVDEFYVEPNSLTIFELQLPTAAYELPPVNSTRGSRDVPGDFRYLGGDGFIYYDNENDWNNLSKLPDATPFVRVYLQNVNSPTTTTGFGGVWIELTRDTPWLAHVKIRNDNAFPVRFATPAKVDGTGAVISGQPAFIIPARIVQPGPEQLLTFTDNTSVATYGPSSFDVGGSEEMWRQTPASFRSLAAEVLTTTASPVPVLDAVDVPHDPRRKLGDRIVLRDPDGLGEVTASIVGLVQTFSDAGTRDQITVRPVVPPGTPI